jgi:hypothetical protein
MEFEFTGVSSAILAAFNAYQRKDDLVARKYQLLQSVLTANGESGGSILFLGFDPWILADWTPRQIFVGLISDEVAKYLDDNKVFYTRMYDDEVHNTIPFDIVVAADEFLTYADNNQRDLVDLMSELANELFITTLRDYKNQTPQARDFSQPTVIKNDENFSVFQEYHNYDYKVKSHWTSYIYENGANINTYGGFKRQPMFFKQLAKFAYDAGAVNFTIHRDLMFKSLLKKNYEHLISVSFK